MQASRRGGFGATVNRPGGESEELVAQLVDAARIGDLQRVSELIDGGVAVDGETDDGDTAVMVAAEHGHLDVVGFLVASGADIDDADYDGRTSLMLAAQRGDLKTMQSLLAHGSNVNAADYDERTPLMLAVEYGHIVGCQLLVANGADVNAKDCEGWTSLMLAVQRGFLEGAQYLISLGANVDAVNCDGRTPLMVAAEFGHFDILKLLIVHGADINAADRIGKTALVLADRGCNVKKLQYLQRILDSDVEDKISSPILVANEGRDDMLRYLIDAWAKIPQVEGCGRSFTTKDGDPTDLVQLQFTSSAGLANETDETKMEPLPKPVCGHPAANVMETISEDAVHEPTCAVPFSATSEWFISLDKIQIDQLEPLGKGGFGQVFCGKYLNSDVVVKKVFIGGSVESRGPYSCSGSRSARTTTSTISRVTGRFASTSTDADILRAFKREAEIWFRLNHPHVVQLFGACDECFPPIFVCEFATNGSLDKYLHLHPDQIWRKLHEVALGVSYLHERGIVHADLKCDNIVMGSDLKAKVTDFGLSSVLRQTEEEDVQISGAVQWVAPECLGDDRVPATFISDIYSLGMCIIQAMRVVENSGLDWEDNLNRRYPWTDLDNSTVRVYVKKRKELPFRPKPSTDEQWALVKKMCAHEPSQRINIADIVSSLEKFAMEEAKKFAIEDHQETLNDFDSYESGVLNQLWIETNSMMLLKSGGITAFELLVFCELEAVFTRLHQSQFSHKIFDRFHRIVVGFNEAIPHGFKQYRIVDLSSKSAKIGSAAHLTRQIDKLRRMTGAPSIGTSTLSTFAKQEIHMFVSADPPMWVMSRELTSRNDRRGFHDFLSSELEVSESNHTEELVGVIRSAYNELDDLSRETIVSAMTPKWFIPWYEIDFEGNRDIIGRGGFGEVYWT